MFFGDCFLYGVFFGVFWYFGGFCFYLYFVFLWLYVVWWYGYCVVGDVGSDYWFVVVVVVCGYGVIDWLVVGMGYCDYLDCLY